MLERVKAKIRGTIDLAKLKKNGLTYGSNFDVQYGVIIDPGHCWLISIGNNVTLAPYVHILAHDASMKKFLGYTKVAKTKIGNNVFIGAGTIILPGVYINDNVIIGAGSVVTKDLEGGLVYAGNPAVPICKLDVFLNKHRSKKEKGIYYNEEYKINNISTEKKVQMNKDLESNEGYII
ncbi:MAG: acyltransferase [Clostridia bacterium]|nr:acyltransferase [Clostridia bacterium]